MRRSPLPPQLPHTLSAGPAPRILVVDDDRAVLRLCERLLGPKTSHLRTLDDPSLAADAVEEDRIEVVLQDLQMPQMDGLTLLKCLKARRPDIEVILMSGQATVENAVEAVRLGATDFVSKPFRDVELLKAQVGMAARRQRLSVRARQLEDAFENRRAATGMIGQSREMIRALEMIETVAPSSTTVLITGESGTGKELAARAVHDKSPRAARPFVAINCAALPENLLESELFGHERGAFTGATTGRPGLFEAADGGSIFLDELGEMPLTLQAKLLRVLQEGEVRRLGSNKTRRVDTRVIAATNVELERAASEGRFREDLYYRLSVLPVALPPLRDRHGDVETLAAAFVARFASREQKRIDGLSDDALDAVVTYTWPGNVRELQNAMERAVLLCSGRLLERSHLPDAVAFAEKRGSTAERDARDAARFDETTAERSDELSSATPPKGAWAVEGSLFALPLTEARREVLEAFERRYVERLMERTDGNVSEGARLASMDRTNFRRLLKRLGLYE